MNITDIDDKVSVVYSSLLYCLCLDQIETGASQTYYGLVVIWEQISKSHNELRT